jgi:hypothetical protein
VSAENLGTTTKVIKNRSGVVKGLMRKVKEVGRGHSGKRTEKL